MSGFYTPGNPLAEDTDLTEALVPADTGLGQGLTPQSVNMPLPMLLGMGPVQALSGAANMTIDASLGNLFTATLTGNRTLGISNLQAGQTLYGLVTQDGGGNRTITVTAGAGGATLTSGTPLSAAGGSVDLVAITNLGTFEDPQYYYYPVAKAFA